MDDGVDRLCADIETRDRDIHAFVAEPGRRERLRGEARRIEERWAEPAERPVLYGMPVGVKDIIHVDGLPTRAGSALPPEALAGEQAAVVGRLRAAGALVAGKTVTAEFAVVAPGETRNPRDLAHTPGGSSSGSAAAVAAGMVPLAVGTQTIGSMIRPAAYCGVTGFKPGYGRIPVAGVIPNAAGVDTVGLFAPDVAGVARASAVVCDGWRPVPDGASAPVLGVPEGPYLQRAGEEALAAFEAQLDVLAKAGATVHRVPVMADFDAFAAAAKTANRYELAQSHARWFADYAELYHPRTAEAVRKGQAVDRAAYEAALPARRRLHAALDAAMSDAGVDLWAAPSATGPAPRGLDSTGDPVMCLPWSCAGLPSLSLPSGRAANGLPLGLQVVARRDADEQLLAWGRWLEEPLAALA